MLLMSDKGGIFMTKEEKKVDFNLSVLELKDLIKVYNEVDNFIKYMKGIIRKPSETAARLTKEEPVRIRKCLL